MKNQKLKFTLIEMLVDPAKIPYGSKITVQTPSGPRHYIAADTGGAVKSMKASGGTTPVIDFYSSSQVGGTYTDVKVEKYSGPSFVKLSKAEKEAFFPPADLNRGHKR